MNLTGKVDLITEKVMKKLFESSENKFYVYHCAHDSSDDNSGYKAIFKFGFERYYVNKGVGNLYGPGVYTTIDLESSLVNARRGEYGRVIIKAEIQSFDKFLIWNRSLAQKVYGDKWRMEDQINMIFPREIVEQMKRISANKRGDGSSSLYEFLLVPREWTSNSAYEFWATCRSGAFRGNNPYDYIAGFVFHGKRDGYVAVVKNVKNLIPVEFSKDMGRTWENGQTEKTLKYTKNDFDTEYLHGKKYSKTNPPSHGWALVERSGKYNYVNKEGKEISRVWLDAGGNFTDVVGGYPMAEIVYHDNSLLLATDGNVYETIDDDYPICHVDELPEYY